jgi:outer membrane protein assembly factor BamE (lipoprotein component of BamABCDE complex)
MLALTASCSPIVDTRGHNEESADLSQIIVGQSRSDDVSALLGSPSAVSSFGDKIWYYITEKKETRGLLAPEIVDQKVTAVTFDENDAVKSIDEVGKGKAKHVDYVEKTTPTEGRTLSAMEQLMGNFGRFNTPGREIDPRTMGR